MAENASENIVYYLVVDTTHKEHLASFRLWDNLKVAYDQNQIWLTNFQWHQIDSTEVKQLPYKEVYYGKEGKLYLLNSLLPNRNEPTLLWTPIQRAFNIQLPSFNHNYFGIEEKLDVKIIPTTEEKEAGLLLVSLDTLRGYIETAPAVRLTPLHWVLVGNNQALIFGKPLLPISGKAFWFRNDMALPVGFDFEFKLLADPIRSKVNPDRFCWVIWNEESSYFKVEKSSLMALSISSFRKSLIVD